MSLSFRHHKITGLGARVKWRLSPIFMGSTAHIGWEAGLARWRWNWDEREMSPIDSGGADAELLGDFFGICCGFIYFFQHIKMVQHCFELVVINDLAIVEFYSSRNSLDDNEVEMSFYRSVSLCFPDNVRVAVNFRIAFPYRLSGVQ